MCAKQSSQSLASESLVTGNIQFESVYRVLRAAVGRPIPRSVDRDEAGRNAKSVKGSSPDKHCTSEMAEQLYSSEGNTGIKTRISGVLDHGMFRKTVWELGRSGIDQSMKIETQRQGLSPKSRAMSLPEVRRIRSSKEVT